MKNHTINYDLTIFKWNFIKKSGLLPSGSFCTCVSPSLEYVAKNCPNCLGHGMMPIPLEDIGMT